MTYIRAPTPILIAVMWLTRIAGTVFALGGLGFFVAAWQDKSSALVAMGLAVLAFGLACISIRRSHDGRLEYGFFRRTR
jgi:hypothetical protein